MEETSVDIIGILVGAVLMFLVPFALIADRSDDISQLVVSTEIASFVDTIVKTGKITSDDYNNFVTNISATGNSYEISFEIKILDKNSAQRETFNTGTIGPNAYYSIYTTQVQERFATSDALILKEGDIVSVTATNDAKTISQLIRNIYYKTGREEKILAATSTGTVAINGSTN